MRADAWPPLVRGNSALRGRARPSSHPCCLSRPCHRSARSRVCTSNCGVMRTTCGVDRRSLLATSGSGCFVHDSRLLQCYTVTPLKLLSFLEHHEIQQVLRRDATCSFGCCSNCETGRNGKRRGARTGRVRKARFKCNSAINGGFIGFRAFC